MDNTAVDQLIKTLSYINMSSAFDFYGMDIL